jgi:hypothetical protein
MEEFRQNVEELYRENSNAVHFAVLLLVSVSVGYLLPGEINRVSQLSAVAVPIQAERPALPDIVYAESRPGTDFGPWMTISKWDACAHFVKQGNVFELQNAEGQVMLSDCIALVPKKPLDWHSEPTRFRLVKEPKVKHSPPSPEHVGGDQP